MTGEVKQLKFGAITKPVIYVDDSEQVQLVSNAANVLSRNEYQERTVAGFTVLIHPEVVQRRTPATQVIRFIEEQLKALNRSIPQDRISGANEIPPIPELIRQTSTARS